MGWFTLTTERMGLAFVEFARDTSVHQTELGAFSVLTLLSCAMLSSLLVWRFNSEDYQVTKFSCSIAPLVALFGGGGAW
jgi:hypothetical protein